MKITLKKASIADSKAYLSLEKQVSGKTYSALKTDKEFLEEIGTATIYLFKIEDEVIGHITYHAKTDGSVHLGGFAIDPKHQGKGFGRESMVLILALAQKATRIDLVTHPDNFKAIGLYESFGFKITERKENYYGDGEPRVILVKNSNPIV
jgi:ribosomal protein S18 acetylase RimI-like enzyme